MSHKVWLERLLNSLPGIGMPASILLMLHSSDAAWYFRLSLLIQLAMQLNYLFGIEYQIERLRVDSGEIGRQNFLRCAIAILMFSVIGIYYPLKVDVLTAFAVIAYIGAAECYANYKMYLVSIGVFRGALSSSILLVVVPFIAAATTHRVIEVLVCQAIAFIALAIWMARGVRGLIAIPSLEWLRTFFNRSNLAAPMMWTITRGDRVITPLFGRHMPDAYMLAGAISDALFGTLRQAQLVARAGGYRRLFLLGAFIWAITYGLVCHFKGLTFQLLSVLPVGLQLIAALVLWFLILRRGAAGGSK
jgi:hypothetical protein